MEYIIEKIVIRIDSYYELDQILIFLSRYDRYKDFTYNNKSINRKMDIPCWLYIDGFNIGCLTYRYPAHHMFQEYDYSSFKRHYIEVLQNFKLLGASVPVAPNVISSNTANKEVSKDKYPKTELIKTNNLITLKYE